jgi:hypothetical protein
MVAFDPAKSLIDGLRSGEVAGIVVQDPYKMGYEGVKAVALHNKGQSSPRLIDTGGEVVTSENLTDPRIMRLLGEQQYTFHLKTRFRNLTPLMAISSRVGSMRLQMPAELAIRGTSNVTDSSAMSPS